MSQPMRVDPETIARTLEETAAQEILPRFRRLADHEISTKDGGELVTSADLAAEAALTRRLTDLLPGSRVVGEEGTALTPALLDDLAGGDPVWLVDPVDGTGNFAAGRPVFAVMVALVYGGEILAGWIHEPVAARTAMAEAGSGAWMAGRRLRVAPPATTGGMRGTLHVGRYGGPEIRRRVEARRAGLGAIRSLHCAGAEYLRLACGEMHYSLFTKMMPWDHAPGVVIHREAGGLARTFDGRPYEPARRDTPGLLLTPDEASWQNLNEVLLA
jgi:fructose-1,6-bisphosphatase/inositol monophosphatase family enzyme